MCESGYIHFLKAGYGDAFILHCRKVDNHGVVVVDGGQGVTPKVNKFLSEVKELDSIDLMVLTHPDDDHLIGIKKFMTDSIKSGKVPVKEIWANCAPNIEIDLSTDVSPRSAKLLTEILDELVAKNEIKWRNDVTTPLTIQFPFADIQVIAPTQEVLSQFVERYREKIGYYDTVTGVNVTSLSQDPDFDTDMEELAMREKRKINFDAYNDASNASSISFILRCDDFSILMLGDTFPSLMVAELRRLGYSCENKLKIDFVKVAHHGSASNISNELLDLVDCQNFIIPTNGKRYRHPDRECLANILCRPLRDRVTPVHLYINYTLAEIESTGKHLFNDDIDKELNVIVHEPTKDDISGLRLHRP